MKKTITIIAILLMIFSIFASTKVYAVNESSEGVIDKNTESQIIEIKDNQAKSLEDYKEKYGSDAYGLVAYILNLVRIVLKYESHGN